MKAAPTPNLSQRDHVRRILASVRSNREAPMFGCPAFFLGRRMVACIYGDAVGIRLPASEVDAALVRDGAVPFRPYGKSMRGWVALYGCARRKIAAISEPCGLRVSHADRNARHACGSAECAQVQVGRQ